MAELHYREVQILLTIFASLEKRGFPPTIREIGDSLKPQIRSTNGVREYLVALERKGFLSREENVARGMKLTQRARDFLTGRAA